MSEDPRFAPEALRAFGARVLVALGSPPEIAAEVADHLVDADLTGFASHGIMRLAQYADWAAVGMFDPAGTATWKSRDPAVLDGGDGFGMPAFRIALDDAVERARDQGLAAVGLVNVGHTGRIGAFAERAAERGCLAILLGGGARRDWPQVAPHGGAKGMLPTNPYALAVPGGDAGPVVIDFATSAGAGGWVYAASYAGRPLPEGLCIDADGKPTTDPADYYAGGALLPMAGPKGYGLALVAELLGDALLGDSRNGLNWIAVVIDLARYRAPDAYRRAAEICLADLRACRPAPGFDRVEIPGERDRRLRGERLASGVPLPAATVQVLRDTARKLGVAEDLAPL